MPNDNTILLEGVELVEIMTEGHAYRSITIEVDGEPQRVFLSGHYVELEEQVRALFGQKVDLVVKPVEWKVGDRSGTKNYLRAIKRSS